MKYVSFLNNDKNCFGILLSENIIDLTTYYERYTEGMELVPSLKLALEHGKIPELNNVELDDLPKVKTSDVILQPVIPNPGKIFCVVV